MQELDPTSQAVCASFFDRLVTPTGSKVACSAESLARWAGPLAPHVPRVLETLSRSRILRTVAVAEETPDATSYEIYHDVLAPAVLDWRHRWVEAQERAQAVHEAREQAAKRALRQWVVALALMTGVAIAGWVKASLETLRAEANRKAAESIASAPFDAGRALDLALDAADTTTRWRLAATSSAEDALRQAIQASRLEWSLPVGQLVSSVAFAPDGRSLAVAGKQGLAGVWDIASGRPRQEAARTFPHGDEWVRQDPVPAGQPPIDGGRQGGAGVDCRRRSSTPGRAPAGQPRLLRAGGESGRHARRDGDERAADRAAGAHGVGADARGRGAAHDDRHGWRLGHGAGLQSRRVLRRDGDGGARLGDPVVHRGVERRDRRAHPERAEPAAQRRRRFHARWPRAGDRRPRQPGARLASRRGRARPPAGGAARLDGQGGRCGGAGGAVERAGVGGPREGGLRPRRQPGRVAHRERQRRRQGDGVGRGDRPAACWRSAGTWAASMRSPSVRTASASPPAGTTRPSSCGTSAGTRDAVWTVAFSPTNGALMATGGGDRTARIWDLSGGAPRQVHRLAGHTNTVFRLAFDPAGRRLVTAGLDGKAMLWDVASGAPLGTVGTHRDKVLDVALSPDGIQGGDGERGRDGPADAGGRAPAGAAPSRSTTVARSPRWRSGPACRSSSRAGGAAALKRWSLDGAIARRDRPSRWGPLVLGVAFDRDGTEIVALTSRSWWSGRSRPSNEPGRGAARPRAPGTAAQLQLDDVQSRRYAARGGVRRRQRPALRHAGRDSRPGRSPCIATK